MPSLDVMIPDSRHIISHVIQDTGCYVCLFRCHIVIVVGDGLSLKDIPIVEQVDVFLSVFPTQLFNQRADPRHGAAPRLPTDKVVGEERSVDIRSFYKFDCNVFLLCHCGRTES